VPIALAGRIDAERTFPTVTSPARNWLPIANYLIWAAEPGKTNAVSEVRQIEVRKPPVGNTPQELDLFIPNPP
jgi:hypothetical protein